jgi:glycerol-3-phosphate dehydrogenase subunit B
VKSDVVVFGAELESLAAALRIGERGAHVRLLMPGAGSLHYSAGGLSVLNAGNGRSPYSAIPQLATDHPYRLLGEEHVRAAIDWFLRWLNDHATAWSCHFHNVEALTMTGRGASVFAHPQSLATLDRLTDRSLAVVALDQHQDFASELCAAGLTKLGVEATVIQVSSPCPGDSVAIARALDNEDGSFFQAVHNALRAPADAVIFPAVLGLRSPEAVLRRAEKTLGLLVYEVATLPPSVFGMRLLGSITDALRVVGVDIHPDIRGLKAKFENDTCSSLQDEKGEEYQAGSFIIANGGVLLGGLEVDSRGLVYEPVCNLDIHQTQPLSTADPRLVLDALHRTGVIADQCLRPMKNGRTVKNVHVAGTLLAHWNPVQEVSNEGVAIASGKAAADFALEGDPQ